MVRQVQPADLSLYTAISEPSFSPDGRSIAISARRANLDSDQYDSDVWVVDAEGRGATKFTEGRRDFDPLYSPDGRSILFLSRRNFARDEKGTALYVVPSNGGEARLVAKMKDVIEEPRWSPDSTYVYFLSFDVKESKDDVKVIRRFSFWYNGTGYIHDRRKHLFRADVRSGSVTQLTKGEFDLHGVAVSNDGSRVAYLAHVQELRPYVSDLFVMSARGGKARRLTSSNMELSALAWSSDDRQLVVSGNDFPRGFASHDRLWLFHLDGTRPELIDSVDRNKANTLNSDVRAKAHGPHTVVWEKGMIYYIQAEGGSAHLYRRALDGKPELVVGGDRSVEGYDVRGENVAYVSMDETHPEELFVKRATEVRLTSFNVDLHRNVNIIPSNHFSFRASDGQDVEGWVMLPGGSGKCPGVLYIHGGPKTSFGHSFMHEFQAFAGRGYAVIFINPRGSDGYSEEFADIRGRYGTRDYDDLMEGLDAALKLFPRIDGSRLGVAGGSYGGYMTNWVVCHTDRFRAAVTDRSISNWVTMWTVSDIGPHFTTDQIGGDPWTNEEKLLSDSPLRYASRVRTPLLLVHSLEDYRCPFPEGIQLYTALKYMKRTAELVLFPGENHDLSRTGKPRHRVARLNHYLRWFDRYLKRAATRRG